MQNATASSNKIKEKYFNQKAAEYLLYQYLLIRMLNDMLMLLQRLYKITMQWHIGN